MSGYSSEDPCKGMTPEEMDKQLQEYVDQGRAAGKTAAQNEFLKKLKNLDYVIQRKIIWNGKMARPGHVFIVVRVNKKTKYIGFVEILGNQDPEIEFEHAERLRAAIKAKYKV
jgi:hypothetical protein